MSFSLFYYFQFLEPQSSCSVWFSHLWVSWVWLFCGNSLQHGLWVSCSHFSLAHYWPRTNFYAYFLGWEFPNCSLNLYPKFPEERYKVQILQEAFSFPLLKPEIDKWAELLGSFFSAPLACDHSSLQGLILGRISSPGAGLLGFASCSQVWVDSYTLPCPGSLLFCSFLCLIVPLSPRSGCPVWFPCLFLVLLFCFWHPVNSSLLQVQVCIKDTVSDISRCL